MSKKNIDIINSDNKIVSKEAKKEPIKVDKRFVKLESKELNPSLKGKDYSVLTRNGRVYQKLDNYYGIWADTGECFRL